jgi:outer membrane protein TolC
MKLKQIIAAGLTMVLSTAVMAQEKTFTLDEVLKTAGDHYPSLKQKQLLEESGKENEKILNASLFPAVNVTGQATYQSEVTALDLPGFPKGIGQKPDNYNIGLEMRFPLTEFGTVETRKELEKAQTSLSVNQVDLDLQNLRVRVTNLVGNILLQQENEKILAVRVRDLDSQRRKVAVGVANGAVLKSNLLVLESEILTTQQRIDDIGLTIQGLSKELATLTGLPIDSATSFRMVSQAVSSQAVNRPELKVFSAQKNVLDLRSELLRKESRPNLYVFGQGFYGRPGFNFLNSNLRVYGLGGVGLSWDLNNLFNQTRQQKLIGIQKQIVNTQEETFNMNLQAALQEKEAEVEKYERIISKDAQIVRNREEIIHAAASQLENGVITSTEYLTELNAENAAELNLKLHQVQLGLAKAQYNILLGY